MKVIEKYARAVENGDETLLREVFAPQVLVEVPAGPSVTHPANTASYILSLVAKIDQLIIYMRPIPVAQRFAEVIMQRLQPTGAI